MDGINPPDNILASAAYASGRKVADVNVGEADRWSAKPGHFVWIDLTQLSIEQIDSLKTQFGLHDIAIAAARGGGQSRPKLETFGDALLITLHEPRRQAGGTGFDETQVFAGKGYVITLRHGPSAPYREVRARCEAKPLLLENGEDFVLHAILESVLESFEPEFRRFEEEIAALEQRILRRDLHLADFEGIYELRDGLRRTHAAITSMAEICGKLDRLDFPFIDDKMRPYFRDLEAHVSHQLAGLTGYSERASQALELGFLLEASRQNVVQRRFAAWAAILGFPTAIAGIYGMNFQDMPELSWRYGYFVVLAVILGGCATLYSIFRRTGWL